MKHDREEILSPRVHAGGPAFIRIPGKRDCGRETTVPVQMTVRGRDQAECLSLRRGHFKASTDGAGERHRISQSLAVRGEGIARKRTAKRGIRPAYVWSGAFPDI